MAGIGKINACGFRIIPFMPQALFSLFSFLQEEGKTIKNVSTCIADMDINRIELDTPFPWNSVSRKKPENGKLMKRPAFDQHRSFRGA